MSEGTPNEADVFDHIQQRGDEPVGQAVMVSPTLHS